MSNKEKKHMQPFDYSVVKNHKMYDVLMPLAKLISKTVFGATYVGTENIPEKGGFIVAVNHIHFSDPIVVAAGSKRRMHFMAKEELFASKLSSFMLTHFNAFPVRRGVSDTSSVKYAIKVAEQGDGIGIFPEGTRSVNCAPKKGKAGVALIAHEAKADVLPVSLYTETGSKPFTKLTVRYGEVIPYEDLGLSEKTTARELRNATRIVMERITELWEKKHAN